MHKVFVWITLLAGVIACGHALAQESQFAYVASTNSETLLGFRIDAVTGDLTPVPGSPFATGQLGNHSVVIDQAGRFVYVISGEDNVIGYKIEPFTGRLTPIPGGTFVITKVQALAIDPLGQYAYGVRHRRMLFLPTVSTRPRDDSPSARNCPAHRVKHCFDHGRSPGQVCLCGELTGCRHSLGIQH